MNAQQDKFLQDLSNQSVWVFALEYGVLRLAGEAVIALWLIFLFRKADLTEWEFVGPLFVCPVLCFLYAALVWFIKRRQAT